MVEYLNVCIPYFKFKVSCCEENEKRAFFLCLEFSRENIASRAAVSRDGISNRHLVNWSKGNVALFEERGNNNRLVFPNVSLTF